MYIASNHLNSKIQSTSFGKNLSYCCPPDRWHLLDTQTWDLLGAPSSCRRLESKSSHFFGEVKGLVRMSAVCQSVPTFIRSKCSSSNCCFIHLKQIFWVLLAYLIVEEFPVLITVIEACLILFHELHLIKFRKIGFQSNDVCGRKAPLNIAIPDLVNLFVNPSKNRIILFRGVWLGVCPSLLRQSS